MLNQTPHHSARPSGGRRAVVVGSGPNGLTAAAVLARAGWEVDVHERHHAYGGASGSADVLGPGTIVDLGAAGHSFGVASPVFRDLDLTSHGLEWLHPEYPMAHPLQGRPAAVLHDSMQATVAGLGADGAAWKALHAPLVGDIDAHLANILGPSLLRWPPHLLSMARFGVRALWPSGALGRAVFRDEAARALFAGSSIHAILPPSHLLTSAFGLIFGALGMTRGWPVARGGSQGIADALVSVLRSHGGRIHLNHEVTDLGEFAGADAILLDVTPRQLLRLKGADLTDRYAGHLKRWTYGTGASKIDYLLDGPVPWTDPRVGGAGTVHVGGSLAEMEHAEREAKAGRMPERPFVMVCQQQSADPSRATGAADGKTVLWTYAHVPGGYDAPVDEAIEAQIERYAPGFRDRIVHRVATPPSALESWNPNLIGGDVAGGSMGGLQQILRPAPVLSPHRTSTPGLYLASSSTPPGGGVHGMAGLHAARAVLADAASHRRTSP
ncbi:NAD(P)/FAD-dependent oxidoreductase [Citricoccus nitrophenolicus]|uniref:Pyridine nucleotide-disulfide oxidoreductase domain-containing protein 2 n=1 Tax=Citricoccus nitrophenolicus TaxID=863575 RepID=A0ABV0IIH0_9MICC|nr:NAD(P)/FAD-dependent oxidoreductase [Citricoccus sp. I39-566]WMY77811.1 NAD(P)/FAD-dependent oxidoreductase [Citricoccus sp. I39-566]